MAHCSTAIMQIYYLRILETSKFALKTDQNITGDLRIMEKIRAMKLITESNDLIKRSFLHGTYALSYKMHNL